MYTNEDIMRITKKFLTSYGCDDIQGFEFDPLVMGYTLDGEICFTLITIDSEDEQNKFYDSDCSYILTDPEVIDWIFSLDLIDAPVRWNIINYNIIGKDRAVLRFARNLEVING